ncbi:YjbE family putative metal transport protein [Priestia filamentosa]|uniref:YjbE family putative metal transport protein n=1 Tax=Priestia filamentosa TaxID=1402861 RepID=UPI003D26E0F1
METLLTLVEIVFINLILSGDNALIIGMASRHLSDMQRRKVFIYGTCGISIIYVVLASLASVLLHFPFVKLVGGILLIVTAVKLLTSAEQVDDGEDKKSKTVRKALFVILLSNVVIGVDNVLSITMLAKGNFPLMIGSIMISIVFLVWGSTHIAQLMGSYPLLITAGSLILTYSATMMMVSDPFLVTFFIQLPFLKTMLPTIFTISVLCFNILYVLKKKFIYFRT